MVVYSTTITQPSRRTLQSVNTVSAPTYTSNDLGIGAGFASATNPQPTDAGYSLAGAGNPVYDTKEQLDAGFTAGKFSASQYQAALDRLTQGFSGVDPLGFNRDSVLPQVGGTGQPINSPLLDRAPLPSSQNPTGARPPAGAVVGNRRQMYPTTAQDALSKAEDYIRSYEANGNTLSIEQKEQIKQTYLKEFETTKNANLMEQQKRELLRKQNQSTESPTTAPSQTTGSQPSSSESVGQTFQQGTEAAIMADPDLAANYLPELQMLQGKRERILAEGQGQLDALDASDANRNGVSDGIEASVASSKEMLQGEKDQADAINKENRDIAVEAANLAKETAEIAKSKFELEQTRNENILRAQNIEQEMKNRRAAARMGINVDTNGLKWMSEEVRKGNEALAFLQQAGDLQESQFALEIGKQYSLSVRSALNAHSATQLQIDGQFRKDLAELDNVVSMDAKERKEEKQRIIEKTWERLDKNDEKVAGLLSEARTEMLSRQREYRAQEFEKWKMDNDPAKNGTISPLQTIEWTKKFSDEIKNLDSVKEFSIIDYQYSKMTAAKAALDNGTGDIGSVDEALAVTWEKILDATSVVRESEFDRVAGGQGFTRSLISGFVKAVQGGQALDPRTRQSLINMAGEFQRIAENRASQDIQPTLMQIADFNRTPGVKQQINVESLPFINRIDDAQAQLDAYEAELPWTGSDTAGGAFGDWASSIGSGNVLQKFDTQTDYSVYGKNQHQGIDIDGKIGDPITAFRGGKVVAVVPDPNPGQRKGFGNQVIIQAEDGTFHQYSHLQSAAVKVGDTVQAGQQIAAMGNTGFVKPGKGGDGSHLDFEILQGGQVSGNKLVGAKPINPETYGIAQTNVDSNFLHELAMAHSQHEGYGTAKAATITEYNNPGALKWTKAQEKYGATRGKDGFAKFPNYDKGMEALMADIQAKLTGNSNWIDYSKNPTLLDYFKVYAPASDGNNPKSYAQAVINDLQKAGYNIAIDTPLSTIANSPSLKIASTVKAPKDLAYTPAP